MGFPKDYNNIIKNLDAYEKLAVGIRDTVSNRHFMKMKKSTLLKDTFIRSSRTLTNPIKYPNVTKELLEKCSYSNSKKQMEAYIKATNLKIKPKMTCKTVLNAAKRATDDPELQKALVELTEREAVVVRTRHDAMPIMREQFNSLCNKENVIVLDINPQMNNGMQKSNTLISRWYTETNSINSENLVTLRAGELRTKALKPCEIHSDWVQGSSVAKRLEKLEHRVETISMDKVREILDGTKGLSSSEILQKYSIEELASAMKTINTNIVAPQKKKGYIGALVAQLELASKNKDNITIVIPDDCSLSGSSMLCDSVKILDDFIKNNPDKKVDVVFSPLILGDKAQNAFNTFIKGEAPFSEMYLRQISAIKTDGTEAYKGIKEAFERVRTSEKINFEVTPNSLSAKHFTETDYFKSIKDPVLKSKLTYLMQGPVENGFAQFGGFGNCGVLVITPTEEFVLNGKKYAGKIPTNSVGYMELLGHEAGVLNDEMVKGKGLFTKGTGKGYSRYCEWEGLAKPESAHDRIPVSIADDGTISIRNN